jgi:hypothetical protein
VKSGGVELATAWGLIHSDVISLAMTTLGITANGLATLQPPCRSDAYDLQVDTTTHLISFRCRSVRRRQRSPRSSLMPLFFLIPSFILNPSISNLNHRPVPHPHTWFGS